MDIALKLAQIVAAICGSIWVLMQASNWVSGRRKKLHAHISYGRQLWPPPVLRQLKFIDALRDTFHFREILGDAPLEEETGWTVLRERLQDRIRGLGKPIHYDITRGWVQIFVSNKNHHTINGIRVTFRTSTIQHTWVVVHDDRVIEPSNEDGDVIELPPLPPSETAVVMFATSRQPRLSELEDALSITYEGGVAKRTFQTTKTLPEYKLSEWYGLLESIFWVVLLFAGVFWLGQLVASVVHK